MAVSFAADIRPLFRDGDIKCMGNPSGCPFPQTQPPSTERSPTAQCLQTSPGRPSAFHFSKPGWMQATPHSL